MFDISGGQKTLFFKKCPNNGLVSEKKYIEKFFIVGGGGRPKYEKFHTFFFLNEGFPKGRLQKIKTSYLVTLSKLTFTPTPPRLIVTFFQSDKVVFS